jgi:ArsR family transcriptional regulator
MARARKKGLSSRDLRDVAQQFKMLSDPTRLRILAALAKSETSVGALARLTEMTQPAVGHHLSLLRASQFIGTRRDSKTVVYSLTELGRVFWGMAETALA